ncbi:hypothetical protein [Ruthenibacterium lactatiformans]|uniref:hypothetical protein n=1 Tax=Ruthenibacterium lactatiformans TaxID=1550024 RepID=UPI00399F89CD
MKKFWHWYWRGTGAGLAACSGSAGYQIGIPADATNGGRACSCCRTWASLP